MCVVFVERVPELPALTPQAATSAIARESEEARHCEQGGGGFGDNLELEDESLGTCAKTRSATSIKVCDIENTVNEVQAQPV